jgi:hypothetical protein
MTESDVSTAMTMWRDQAAGELPWGEIERALRRLPDAGICAVSHDGSALFMLAATDTLFTVAVHGDDVTLHSRPLDSDRLVVRLRSSANDSHWSFDYLGEPQERERWQDISGSVATNGGREQIDDREQFARAVAARAGWAHGPEGPSGAEAAAAPSAEQAGEDVLRWRARTDVWGRPLDVRRG